MLVSRKLNFSNTSQVESYYVAKLSPLDDGDQRKIDPEKVEIGVPYLVVFYSLPLRCSLVTCILN